MSADAPLVAVVGSLHLDIVVRAPRLPDLDETLPGESWTQLCGGKGHNQAVAAARMGARAAMVGRVGRDAFGERLLAHLSTSGVDRAHVAVDAYAGSGMSVAILDAAGDYGAVIVSGANRAIPPGEAAAAVRALAPRVLLLQNEAPEAVNRAAAEAAKAAGALVVVNAAPVRPDTLRVLALADVVIANRIEATAMTGHLGAEAAAAALAREAPAAILTRGGDGYMVAEAGAVTAYPAFPAKVVSTHGAGDMFAGALAARLAAGAALSNAARFAAAAAALHVAADDDARARIAAADAAVLAGV